MGLIRTALIFAAGYALGRPYTREKVVSQAQQLWQRYDVQQLKQRGTQTVTSTVQQVKDKTPLGKGSDGATGGASTGTRPLPKPASAPVPPPVPPTPPTPATTASVPPVPPDLADPPVTPPIPPADPIKPIDPLGEKPISGRPSTPPL